MSLILKGIDMPKNGDYHHITIYDNGNTYITTSNVLYETDRKDVKVIQIPTPHGDIKDINTVEDELDSRCGQLSAEIVRHAPTILDEEGK